MMPASRMVIHGGTEEARVAESADDTLLRVASTACYFRSTDGRFHARVPVQEGDETYGLLSPEFRDWMIEGYRGERRDLPPAQAISRVVRAIAARARFDGDTPAVHVRVACDRGGGDGECPDFYVDLGNRSGQAVRINDREWLVLDRPPVHFRRPVGQLPLPVPIRGGSIELLRRYVNLSEPDFRLLVGWMAAALLPEGPYPVLAVHGEQGSAKSTLAKVVRLLIDPQISPVLAEPRSTRDLLVTAANGWLMAYDNISVVPNWLSDSLCRLSSGGGFAGRALYSNDERSVIHAQRPVILNGIDEFVRRDDLADRCVYLHLPPISAAGRRAEGEFWRAFRADSPRMLGALLDAVVGGLSVLPSMELTELPRMADFARLGDAVGRGLGWPEGSFLAAYNDNRQAATATSLEDSVIANVLLTSAAWGGLDNWTLSASEMLKELAGRAGPRFRASVHWPKTARSFADLLRRLAPQLRTRGITITFTRSAEKRLITIDADKDFDFSPYGSD